MRISWLIRASTFLLIGSSIALSEELIRASLNSILPDAKEVTQFKRVGTITILSSNGEVIQKVGQTTRQKTPKGKMPILLERSFIAAEDKRFYKHKGIDFLSILRATIENISEGTIKEGASTITQQLARIVYLNQEQTFARKIKEAALALKLESELTKKEILENYLNNVYLGSSAYGVADAAWIYFSKSPNELELEEAALIAGLAPAPSIYSPLINPLLALKRRNIILERMKGENFITPSTYRDAIKRPLNLNPQTPKYLYSSAPYFSSWVFEILPEFLTPEQIELGGITIYTTLNLEWQEKAQQIIRNYSPEGTEGALVSIAPENGFIRALVGGKDFQENQFNRATQALRSPGSTFKLIVFAAALNNGLQVDDIFLDSPKCWNNYCPKNFNQKYLGEIPLSKAFTSSSNIIAVKLLDIVGFEEVITTANKFGLGVERKLDNYYSLAIGAYEETLLNMTNAYASIENKGLYIKATPIKEIRGPKNKIIWDSYSNIKKSSRVTSENVANTLSWMLEETVNNGTGSVASLDNFHVAGKTGTSEGNRDLWFIGSVQHLTTGVWFGYDNNSKTKSTSGNAAWAWKKFIQSIESDLK